MRRINDLMTQMKDKMAETSQSDSSKWNLDNEFDKLMIMLKQEYVRLSEDKDKDKELSEHDVIQDVDIMDDTNSFLQNELNTQAVVSPSRKYELTVPGGLKSKKDKKRTASQLGSGKKRRTKAERERRNP